MSATMTVTCGCGTVGERQVATGRAAAALNRWSWTCPQCAERAERAEADEAERERQASRQRTSSVPGALRRSLDELEVTQHNAEALRQARAWAAGDTPGLLLTGPIGTGKTSIAAAAAWDRQLQKSVLWASVPTMLANAMRAFGDTERAAALQAITGTGGLALDDLDKVKPTEWAGAQLFSAIDSRVAAGRPLAITMNLTPGELATKLGGEFGEAIASRLVGYCAIVVVGGDDRRLAAGRRLHSVPDAQSA